MAITLPASQHLLANSSIRMYDFDPDADTATDIAWVDMRDYEYFLIGFFRTVGTGNLDTFKILANDASDGSGTDIIVKTHAIGSEPNLLSDQIWLECRADEVAAEGIDQGLTAPKVARYVTANVEFATSTDEGVILYILGGAKNPNLDLTADIIA